MIVTRGALLPTAFEDPEFLYDDFSFFRLW
jgi:hypothetical protein